MRTLVSAVLLVLALAACGGGPVDSEDIDREAWAADLAEAGAPNADLDALEDVTRGLCDDEVDDLALMLTLEGSQPDVLRVSMGYVCPDDAHKVDDALEDIQESTREREDACDTEPQLRTQEQKDLVEFLGC